MDWFQKWPRDALDAVAHHFLERFPIVCSPETKSELMHSMGMVHDDVAETCVKYFQRYNAMLLHSLKQSQFVS